MFQAISAWFGILAWWYKSNHWKKNWEQFLEASNSWRNSWGKFRKNLSENYLINFVRNFEALPDEIPQRIHLKMPGRIPKTMFEAIIGENHWRFTFKQCWRNFLRQVLRFFFWEYVGEIPKEIPWIIPGAVSWKILNAKKNIHKWIRFTISQ